MIDIILQYTEYALSILVVIFLIILSVRQKRFVRNMTLCIKRVERHIEIDLPRILDEKMAPGNDDKSQL